MTQPEIPVSDLDQAVADSPMRALDEAIAACSNSVTVFAARIGVGQSTVSMWKTRGRVASDSCPAIERETGVRCERLRPDIPWEVLRLQTAANDEDGADHCVAAP